MPETFQPFDYQQEMLRFCESRDVVALFASPGLGKTPVTLRVIADRIIEGDCRGALVVAPLRVGLITWPSQVAKWRHSAWMRCVNMRTPEGRKAWEEGSADIYLINPEMLPKLLPGMMDRETLPADMLVLDELSVFKSSLSVRAKLLSKHAPRFPQRIGLTGTPVPNTYLDLFQQAKMLDDGKRLGRSFHHFRQTWFESDYMGFKFTIREGAKETIDAKLSDMCLVMLGEDYLDVPPCTTTDIEVTMPPDAKAAYKKLEKELLLSLANHEPMRIRNRHLRERRDKLIQLMGLDGLDLQSPFISEKEALKIEKRYRPLADEFNRIAEELKGGDVVALNAATLAGKLLQITSGAVYGEERVVNLIHDAKIDALKKLRKKHGKEPILVLTAYQHEMERVLAAIPGSRRFHERDMDEWKAGRIHTWVAQPGSMSHGIDGIQDGGRIAVWMTLTWSNESYMQTNARLVRTGQLAETRIYRLTCPGTMDDIVAEALRTKSDTQSGLLNALKALQLYHNQKP